MINYLAISLFDIIYPVVMILLFAIWAFYLVKAVKAHRPWHWIAFMTFAPIVSIPFYIMNFHILGRGSDEGYIDKNIGSRSRISELKKVVDENGLLVDVQQLAVEYFETQNYKEALRYFQQALEMDPEDLKCQYFSGVAFLALSEGERALPHLEYVLEEDARYAQGEARLYYAKSLLNAGENERAQTEFARAASHFNLPEASVRSAHYLVEEGKFEEAQETLVEMLQSVGELHSAQRTLHKRWIKIAAEDLAKIQRQLKEKKTSS